MLLDVVMQHWSGLLSSSKAHSMQKDQVDLIRGLFRLAEVMLDPISNQSEVLLAMNCEAVVR